VVVVARFGVQVESLDADIVAVHVRGEIDMATTPELVERLLPLAESGPPGLVVDLSECEFMGAAGIHALEEMKAALLRRGGRLAVVAPDGIPLRVLEVTGMTKALTVVPSIDAARVRLG
jgi:anti-sigma B factor antagonist